MALAAVTMLQGQVFRVASVSVSGLPKGVTFRPDFKAGDSVEFGRLAATGDSMTQRLRDVGYLEAVTETDTVSTTRGLAVHYAVTAGSRQRIAGWDVRGIPATDSVLVQSVLPRSGGFFTRQLLGVAVNAVLHLYERRGHPLAKLSPAELRTAASGVVPVLQIDSGPLALVRYVEFEGRRNLSPVLLARATRFTPGLSYSPARVRSWSRNLEQTGLARVLSSEIVQGPGYGIRYSIVPRAGNSATALFGYAPESRSLSGILRLEAGNLLNTGRRLSASWAGVRGRTDWFLSYTEPWVFGQDISLTGSAGLAVVDTSWSKAELGLAGKFQTGEDVAVTAGLGFEQVGATDTLVSSRTAWAETGVELDTRDKAFGARSGAQLVLATRAGERMRRGAAAGVAGRATADALFIGPSAGRFLLESRGHYRLAYAQAGVTVQDLFRLGGARTIRGYREQQFGTAHAAWLDLEPQFEAGEQVRVYGFADGAVLQTGAGWFWPWSYGLGLRAETRIGLADLAYGLPATARDPLAGLIHLSLSAEF